MRQLRNTLYITNPDLYLGRNGQTIEVRNEERTLAKLPIHNFEQIICFNYTGISPGLLQLCSENGVIVTYLTSTGKYIGTFDTEIRGSVLTRKKQFKLSENEIKSLEIAKCFILGKIQNSLNLLMRTVRDHKEKINTAIIEQSIDFLKDSKQKVTEATEKGELMGIEGDASRSYFRCFNEMILTKDEVFIFKGRTRRPPLDRVNALLSLSYGFLRVRVESALYTAGLDPYTGFLHTDRPGRASLALDLMEELRPVLADRLVLRIVNRKQMKKNHFIEKANGAIELTEDGFRTFIDLWNDQMLDTITHPFLEEKIEKGLLPYCQAKLLSKFIRDDLVMYPLYFMG